MSSILSTKKLTKAQEAVLLHAGLSVEMYDAIHIQFLPFTAPKKIENAIFTSQNSVRAISNRSIEITHVYCVGNKTKALLEKNGYKVVETAEDGAQLANLLVENYAHKNFYFFCGNKRRNEIPENLKKANISFTEIITYQTLLNPVKFEKTYNGILFFSPSGVESFIKGQAEDHSYTFPSETIAFCIGATTASEAKKHTKNIVISDSASVESVLSKAVFRSTQQHSVTKK